MKILLTNDDGWHTSGILSLFRHLGRDHEVTLVAPDREKSAVSHAITLKTPLRIQALDFDVFDSSNGSMAYAVDGTPADCVKLGLAQCFTTRPDMVVSGINPGVNIGIDMYYSGTVAAAREGALNGIPSLAVSIKLGEVMDYDNMAAYTARLVKQVGETRLPKGTFLNVNAPDIPLDRLPEIEVTHQSLDNISPRFEERRDTKNKAYFWYENPQNNGARPGSDLHAVAQGHISITPVQCDITDHTVLREMSRPAWSARAASGL